MSGSQRRKGKQRAVGRAPAPRPGAGVTRLRHRVPFYETDAMGIVHHSNYVRYLELGRIAWMDEHDEPYRRYVEDGLHFATTRLEVAYRRSVPFDAELEIVTWVEKVHGASLWMAYEIHCDGELVVTASTQHVMVSDAGRPRRIPRERRERLAAKVGAPSDTISAAS